MFATNFTYLERDLPCNGQCEGECTGHKIELHIHNTSNVGSIIIDGDHQMWLSSDEADALYGIFKEIKEDDITKRTI